MEGFCDADYAGAPSDWLSTIGYFVFDEGNLVSWKSKKQSVVFRSSAESENCAMTNVTCELLWLKHLLEELGFNKVIPMQLWCDNKTAIHIANNSIFHERTKHIEVRRSKQWIISANHVRIGEQPADILTKVLENTRVTYLCNKLDMIYMYSLT